MYFLFTLFFIFFNPNTIFCCCCCYGHKNTLKEEEIKKEQIKKKENEEIKKRIIKKNKNDINILCDNTIRECKEYKRLDTKFEDIINQLNNLKKEILSAKDDSNEIVKIRDSVNKAIIEKDKLKKIIQNEFKNFINSNKNFISEKDFNKLIKGKTFELDKFIVVISDFFDSEKAYYCDNTEGNMDLIKRNMELIKNYFYSKIIDGNFTTHYESALILLTKVDATNTTTLYDPEETDEKFKKKHCSSYKCPENNRNEIDNIINDLFEKSTVNPNIYEIKFKDINYFIFNGKTANKIKDKYINNVKEISYDIKYIILDNNGNFIDNNDYNLKLIDFSYYDDILVTFEKFISKDKISK